MLFLLQISNSLPNQCKLNLRTQLSQILVKRRWVSSHNHSIPVKIRCQRCRIRTKLNHHHLRINNLLRIKIRRVKSSQCNNQIIQLRGQIHSHYRHNLVPQWRSQSSKSSNLYLKASLSSSHLLKIEVFNHLIHSRCLWVVNHSISQLDSKEDKILELLFSRKCILSRLCKTRHSSKCNSSRTSKILRVANSHSTATRINRMEAEVFSTRRGTTTISHLIKEEACLCHLDRIKIPCPYSSKCKVQASRLMLLNIMASNSKCRHLKMLSPWGCQIKRSPTILLRTKELVKQLSNLLFKTKHLSQMSRAIHFHLSLWKVQHSSQHSNQSELNWQLVRIFPKNETSACISKSEDLIKVKNNHNKLSEIL